MKMRKAPVLFPMSNPIPEIMPNLALEAGAAVVGTGRSDFANQINNVLAFPSIFRGAFDVRESDINDETKIAAAYALAGLISDAELKADYIIPAAFDPRVKMWWPRLWRKPQGKAALQEFKAVLACNTSTLEACAAAPKATTISLENKLRSIDSCTSL